MKYRTTQLGITETLNMIDKAFESRFESGQPFSGVDKFNIGNGLKQIETDVEDLCSYIDEIHKTLTDREIYIKALQLEVSNAENLIKEYEKSLNIIPANKGMSE